jgi:hypothetical protein
MLVRDSSSQMVPYHDMLGLQIEALRLTVILNSYFRKMVIIFASAPFYTTFVTSLVLVQSHQDFDPT